MNEALASRSLPVNVEKLANDGATWKPFSVWESPNALGGEPSSWIVYPD
jgi:hypothetical protein